MTKFIKEPVLTDFTNFSTEQKDLIDKVLNCEHTKTGWTIGLYIYGEVGTGKTHLAHAIFKEYQKRYTQRKTVVYESVDLFNRIKKSYEPKEVEAETDDFWFMNPPKTRNKPETEYDILLPSRQAWFMLLDDIGSEYNKNTDWYTEVFTYMFDNREPEFTNIITSNLNLPQLAQRYNHRLASRIAQRCLPFKMTGEDWRFKGL